MAYINLLPWRDAARKERQKEFLTILTATAVMSFLLVFVVNMIYGARIEGQQQKNSYLQSEIKILDQKIAEIKGLSDEAVAMHTTDNFLNLFHRIN